MATVVDALAPTADRATLSRPEKRRDVWLVREASIADAPAIAQIYVETARSQYARILPGRALADLSVASISTRWARLLLTRRWVKHAYVAETAAGRIVGFSAAGPSRRGPSRMMAELYALYVLPPYQRRGIGRLLFERTWLSMIDRHASWLVASVFVENPARTFFEAVGGRWLAPGLWRSGPKVCAYCWATPFDLP